MGTKRVTIHDVATRAGVSIGTVSNVLRGRVPVGAELTRRVREAVQALGYVADRAASGLRSARPPVAGMLVPDLANPFFASLVCAVEEAARAQGVELIVAASGGAPERERARLQALAAWRPAGIVVVPTDDRFEARDVVQGTGVPIVLVDRAPEPAAGDTVAVQNEAAAALATRHLLEGGHRRILAVATSLALSNVRERWAGVQSACARFGGAAGAELIEAGFEALGAEGALKRRLGAGLHPDAIFTLSNTATLGALAALAQLGLEAPRDLGLIGFDDYAWMASTSPAISAVRQPVEALGAAAWAQLGRRLAGDAGAPSHLRLDCELVIRSSSRRAPAAAGPYPDEPRRLIPCSIAAQA